VRLIEAPETDAELLRDADQLPASLLRLRSALRDTRL